MPTTFPAQPPNLGAQTAPRRRPYGILRTAAMIALLFVARLMFAGAMRFADFADAFVRRD